MARSRKRPVTAPLTVSRAALLADGSDEQFRALIHDLIAYGHRLDDCRNAFGAIAGISGLQYEILMLVGRSEGLSVGAVAARLHRSGAFITIEAAKLVQRGVLEKAQDPEDGRKVRLRLAARGEQMLRRLAPAQQQVNDTLFDCLDAKRFRELRLLARELVNCGDRGAALAGFLARDSAAQAA